MTWPLRWEIASDLRLRVLVFWFEALERLALGPFCGSYIARFLPCEERSGP